MSVNTHKVYFKKGSILATLLGCSALYLPMNAEAAVAVANTSWAVSRVASASLGSYCTMAQKYSDDTVLTFAQNMNEEYSLALDFKDKKFTAGKKQSISIAIDGGKTKSFDVITQSETTAVVGIGKDSEFIQKVSGAGKLNIKVGSETSDFELSEFTTGQKEMGVCIDALRKPVAAEADMVAQKSVTSSPKPVIQKNEVSLKPIEVNDPKEPSVETLLAEAPKSSADIEPLQENIIPVTPVKSNVSAQSEKAASLQVEVASLREENAKLSRALSEQRKSFEDKISNADAASLSELKEKLEAAEVEKKSLSNQVAQMNSKAAANKDNSDALVKLQAENADLKQAVASLKSTPKETPAASVADDELSKLRVDNRKLNGELELLEAEKSALQTQAANLQKDLESKQLKMSGGSWDLEQATRRYQESQREIVRLGALLQSQDVKCANEKKDIEYMLFDPAIATKAQIAMLNSMEDQIKEKDIQLKSAEAESASAKPQPSPEQDAKIAELQKTVAMTQVELAEKKQLLSDAQSKLQASQTIQNDLAGKTQTLASLQSDLALKSQQLAEAQSKLSTTAQKDAELVSVKTLLSQTQAQLATEQANAQKIDVKAQAQQSAEQAAAIASLQLQVQQANQTIIQLQNQISSANHAALKSASAAATMAAVAPTAASNVQQAKLVSAPIGAAHFKSIDEFSSILKNAGVSVNGAVQQVKSSDPATYRAYSWKTDSLYGSAEMRKVSDAGQFDTNVNQYLSRAKARCKGEFAAVPSPVKASGMTQSKAYEIACVGDASSSSASVLFTYGNQITTIVAHEGRAEAMDLAIDARDKISSKIN